MIIEDVQCYLQNLIQLLDNGGGKGPAVELEHLRAGLDPYRKMTMKEFGEVLRQAQNTDVLGKSRSGTKSRPKTGVDKALVEKTLQEVEQLFDRANNASALEHEMITEEVRRWDKSLNKEEGLEVSRLFLGTGFAADTSKRAALEAVGRKIADRLSAQKRIENLDRPYQLSDLTNGAIAS